MGPEGVLQEIEAVPAQVRKVLDLPPAGFWIRLGAFVIDSVFLFAVNLIVIYSSGVPVGLATRLGSMAVSFVYFGATTGAWGQSFGKMLAGVVVVREEDGGPVGYGRAFGRAAAHFLSGIVLCMGYVVAAFTPQKRALHDYLARTRVVYSGQVPTPRKAAVIATGILGVFLFVFISLGLILMINGALGAAAPGVEEGPIKAGFRMMGRLPIISGRSLGDPARVPSIPRAAPSSTPGDEFAADISR